MLHFFLVRFWVSTLRISKNRSCGAKRLDSGPWRVTTVTTNPNVDQLFKCESDVISEFLHACSTFLVLLPSWYVLPPFWPAGTSSNCKSQHLDTFGTRRHTSPPWHSSRVCIEGVATRERNLLPKGIGALWLWRKAPLRENIRAAFSLSLCIRPFGCREGKLWAGLVGCICKFEGILGSALLWPGLTWCGVLPSSPRRIGITPAVRRRTTGTGEPIILTSWTSLVRVDTSKQIMRICIFQDLCANLLGQIVQCLKDFLRTFQDHRPVVGSTKNLSAFLDVSSTISVPTPHLQ